MLDRVSNANDNIDNFGAVFISWISGDIDLVVEDKIVKILTGTKIDCAEKILIKDLSNKVANTNDMAAGKRPKA